MANKSNTTISISNASLANIKMMDFPTAKKLFSALPQDTRMDLYNEMVREYEGINDMVVNLKVHPFQERSGLNRQQMGGLQRLKKLEILMGYALGF